MGRVTPVEDTPAAAAVAALRGNAIFGGFPERATVQQWKLTLVPIGQPPKPPKRIETQIEGPPFSIDPDSVALGKHREIAGRHVFAASFRVTVNTALGGKSHEEERIVVAEPSEGGGWSAFKGSGIGNGRRRELVEPCVGFGHSWNATHGFTASARVFRGTADVSTVRLCSEDGFRLEADAEDDLALFFAPQPVRLPDRIEIELCGASGEVIARQTWERRRKSDA